MIFEPPFNIYVQDILFSKKSIQEIIRFADAPRCASKDKGRNIDRNINQPLPQEAERIPPCIKPRGHGLQLRFAKAPPRGNGKSQYLSSGETTCNGTVWTSP